MKLIFFAIFFITPYLAFSQINIGRFSLPNDTKSALLSSGENQKELEKVLNHYSKNYSDSLRFKAACFLIENLKWHRSNLLKIEVDPDFLRIFKLGDSLYYSLVKGKKIDEINDPLTIAAIKELGSTMKDTIRKFAFREPILKRNFLKKSDLEVINSQFLIDHINNAFETRNTSSHIQKLSFVDFCEFVLPYRIVDGPYLRYSGKQFAEFFAKYLGNVNTCSISEVIEKYNLTINNLRIVMGNYLFKYPTGFEELFFKGPPNFDCFDVSNFGHLALNSCGVPVTTQFNIAYAIFQNKHSDQTIPESLGYWTPFSFEKSIPLPKSGKYEEFGEYIERKRMNFYRLCFSVQYQNPFFLKTSKEYVPSVLMNPCIMDVTDLNLITTALSLPFHSTTSNNIAYLATFNSAKEMVPVTWGIIDKIKRKVTFDKVIPNTLYFPVYYTGENHETFGHPFFLKLDSSRKEGYQLIYIEDNDSTLEKKNVVLLRKFPRKPNMIRLANELIGAYVLGFNSLKGKKDTLYKLKSAPHPYLQDISLNNDRAYKYYQIRPAIENTKLKMSEIYFLTDKKYGYANTCNPPAIAILNSSQKGSDNALTRVIQDSLSKLSRLFEYDGSMETVSRDSIITLILKEPQVITSIRFAPQNANNGIVSGDNYLLRYWGKGKWQDFGEPITANANYLEFKGVPKGKLYWLKNLTRGKEELPFTIDEAGQQQFLYFDLN